MVKLWNLPDKISSEGITCKTGKEKRGETDLYKDVVHCFHLCKIVLYYLNDFGRGNLAGNCWASRYFGRAIVSGLTPASRRW